jgi:hypothetical protein
MRVAFHLKTPPAIEPIGSIQSIDIYKKRNSKYTRPYQTPAITLIRQKLFSHR